MVAFFGERASGHWRSVDLVRFNNLLGSSIVTMLMAFLPLVLFKLGMPEAAVWRWSSGVMASWYALSTRLTWLRVQRLPAEERGEFPPAVLFSAMTVTVVVFCLLLAGAVGFVYDGESGPYITGLFWLMAFSALQFVRLLTMLRQTGDDGD